MTRLFASKKKTVVAIVFTALYTLLLLLDVDFRLPFFQNFRYALNSLMIYLMPLITPALVLVFLLLENKNCLLKNWLLPVAFGIKLLQTILLFSSNFAVLDMIFSNPAYVIAFVCGCFMLIALGFMFVGTLLNCKYISLLKYGTLAYVILLFVSTLTEFWANPSFPIWQNIPSELLSSYLFSYLLNWAQTITRLLFYVGIFMLTIRKRVLPQHHEK